MKKIYVFIKEKFPSEPDLYIPEYLDTYVQKSSVFFSNIIPPRWQ